MSISEQIAANFNKTFSSDGRGDNVSQDHFSGLTLGVVVDTDDPLQTGRLRIFCPSLNDNPKKVQHLPWSSYVSPFAGNITNSKYFRGSDSENATSDGGLHYGFWSIPEMGAHVLVGCIDGDPRRRFWIGCIPEHQQANTIHHGRYKWDDGNVEGPLTGTNSPMQPLYDNMKSAFSGQSDSPEFRSRAAEYQTAAVSEDVGQVPNSKMASSLDQQNSQIVNNNPDTWEHAAMGAHGYDWTGFKSIGGFMSSRVFGWSTPGMHAITMDDRAFNTRMRLRTTAGHQILMDDSNERIYISTFDGKNYIEMDANGNIDCHSSNRISFFAEKDINFTTKGTYRVHARDGIHMFSGDTNTGVHTDVDEPYEMPDHGPPIPGEIRIQSTAGITQLSQGDIRTQAYGDQYTESGGNYYAKTDMSYFNEVAENINVVTTAGSYNVDIASDVNENVGRDSKRFSQGNSSIASNGTNEVQSFQGSTDIGARDGVNMKTATGNVSMESNGYDGGGGAVTIKTPDNEIDIGNNGINIASAIAVAIAAAKGVNLMVDDLLKSKIKSPINRDAIPVSNPPTADDIGVTPSPSIPINPDTNLPFPLPWVEDYTNPDGTTNTRCRQSITIDEAVLVAYNAGFRGQDLIIAVAVAMAESNLMTLSHKKIDDDIFAENVGLFNIKTLRNPSECKGLEYRDNRNRQLENPNTNAEVAFRIFTDEAPFSEWSGGKWASIDDGRAESYIPEATAAVERFSHKTIKLSDEIRNVTRQLEIRLGQLSGLMNGIVTKTDAVYRTIERVARLRDAINGLLDAAQNGNAVGVLMNIMGSEMSSLQDQLAFLASNVVQNLIPPDVLGVIADVQQLMNTVNSLLSTISALASMGKSVMNMDGMIIDMDAPFDINLRTPAFGISQIGLLTQYNYSAIAISLMVSAIDSLTGGFTVPNMPMPMPFPPNLLPSQIPTIDIPKVKIPAFSNSMVGDIMRNYSSDSIRQTLMDKEKEWRNKAVETYKEDVNTFIARFDGDNVDPTGRIPT